MATADHEDRKPSHRTSCLQDSREANGNSADL